MKIRLGHVMGLLATTMIAGAAPAWGEVSIEEIVVSAQKREQNLQDVSIAIAAFTGDEVSALGFREPSDIAVMVPNVTAVNVFGNSQTNFSIRGIGLNDIAPNSNSPAAVHLDEVYLSYGIMLNFGLFDVDRVEVLKGPQGTLYGRNTTGGAVNIFSRRPGPDPEAEIKASFGNYDNLEFEGFVNAPINDKVAVRLSAFMRRQWDGPWHNVYLGVDRGEIEKYGARFQIAAELSETFDINLKIHGGSEDSDVPDYTAIPSGDGMGGYCGAFFDGSLKGGEPDCFGFMGEQKPNDDPFETFAGQASRLDIESIGGVLTMNWDTGVGTLTSISAFEHLDRYLVEDADGFPQQIVDEYFDSNIDQYSQELRLASDNEGPFNWIVGAYWEKDTLDVPRVEVKSFEARGIGVNNIFQQKGETFAGFAHTEYLLTEQLRLIAGLRYTWEERKFDGGTWLTSGSPDVNDDPADLAIQLSQKSAQKSFEDVSGKIGLDFMPNEDTLLYASFSKGFKSGGYNGNLAFADEGIAQFDEEILYSYEVGSKLRMAGGRVIWNTAAFYYDYNDIQLVGNFEIIGPGNVPTNLITLNNLADARTYGVESEVWWRPTEELDVKLAAAYLDTKLTNPKPGNEALDGNELANAPEFSMSGLVRYEKPVSESLNGMAQIDFQYQGETFSNISNIPVVALDDYWVFNARLGLLNEDAGWKVEAYARNIFDKEYANYSVELGSTRRVLRHYGYPRTYGLQFTYHWN